MEREREKGEGKESKNRVKKGMKDEKKRKREGERERKQGGGSFCIFKPCSSCSRTFFCWANSRIQKVSPSEWSSNCASLPNFHGNPLRSSCDCVAQAGKPGFGRTQPLSRCTPSWEKISTGKRVTHLSPRATSSEPREGPGICGSPS